jgi:hypothetical protein
MVGISDIIGKEGKINQLISFFGVFGKILSPESATAIGKKVYSLMGFNSDDISLQGMQQGAEQQAPVEQSVLNQLSNQPEAGGVPSIPNIPTQPSERSI